METVPRAQLREEAEAAAKKKGKEEDVEIEHEPASELLEALMAAAVQAALALEDGEIERQEDPSPANLLLAAEGKDGLPDDAAERQRQGQYVQDDDAADRSLKQAARELLERLPSAQVILKSKPLTPLKPKPRHYSTPKS